MKVSLISYTKDAMETVEKAAAFCYDSDPTPEGRITKSCYASGHTSVLEHMSFTFRIEGISRVCSHQLVRHRIASYSQRSQRYCKESGFEYVTPDSISKNPEILDEYQKFMKSNQAFYDKLIELQVPAEDTRMILPNACCTAVAITINLRSLINFCNERMCTRAQWEIRELANAMKEVIHMAIEVPVYGGERRITQYMLPKCEKYTNYPFCPEARSCGRHWKISEIYIQNENMMEE